MSSVQSKHTVGLHVENVGGIDETEVELGPGVNVLAGRNATNRTSLLQAIMAALGSNRVSLKGDAAEGRVELTIDGETYTRTLTRTDGSISFGGDPVLEDPELADLYALLLESNEARQAVARGEDLREIIMRPVDSDAIQAEIGQLEREKREVEDRIEELERRGEQLPKLEERRTALESELEEVKAELEEKREALDETDVDVEEGREERATLQSKLSELRDLRSDLEEVDFDLETERESLRSLQSERSDLESELESNPDTPTEDRDELEAEIEDRRERKRQLDSVVSQLQNLIQFNENVLDGEGEQVFDLLHDHDHGPGSDGESGSVTDQLVENGTVTCWTCGSDVERESIEETVDSLRNLRKEKVAERTRVRSELDDLKSKVERIESAEDRRRTLRRKYERLGDQITSAERRIERLEGRREEIHDDIQSLEETVEDLRDEDFGRVLDLHKEVNELEFRVERKRDELDEVRDEIEEIERDLGRLDNLESQKEDLKDELADLRTRVSRLEEDAVENFNEHVERVLDILEYDNLERIWIERTEREVRDGRRTVQTSTFDLHVVRNTDSGAAYEDTVDHLSESEREVTGLVFALAGFLVHDVYETVPFMLLDSLEAVDSDRIAKLVDYFEQYPEYLVVALLPEDAAALDEDYRRVTDI